MKWKKYLPDLLFVLLSLAVGGLSAFAVMKGMPAYLQLRKPPLTPPPIVFPVVWGALYLLMGLGAGRVWRAGPPRRAAVAAYAVQLVWNALWTVWFFALQAHLFAFWASSPGRTAPQPGCSCPTCCGPSLPLTWTWASGC